jgi:hypothetical protein
LLVRGLGVELPFTRSKTSKFKGPLANQAQQAAHAINCRLDAPQ